VAVYRARVEVDGIDVEIEAQSLDELKKAIADAGGRPVDETARKGRSGKARKTTQKRTTQKRRVEKAADATDEQPRSPIEIVNAIKDDDRWSDIESRVLDNRSELPRILLVGYFAGRTNDPSITTADIQAVTDELGVRIRASNAANSLKAAAGRYFTSDRVRKQGQVVRYRLNRAGEGEFLRILDAD
jgi:hypothetical protein